jgi:hypothetical protein
VDFRYTTTMTTISNAVASSSKKSNGPQLPLSLSVSQRDEANQLIPQTSDAQALVESMEIKRWRVKESDKWVDRLMFKDKVGAEHLKKSVSCLILPHCDERMLIRTFLLLL